VSLSPFPVLSLPSLILSHTDSHFSHRSSIISQHITRSFSTTRWIFVEPHLIATFIAYPPTLSSTTLSSEKPRKYTLRRWREKEKVEKVVSHTADVYVGPAGWGGWAELEVVVKNRRWEKLGLWRKGGKEAVEWWPVRD
jgi:hypothetical protein